MKIRATSPSVAGMRALLIIPFLLLACGNEEEMKKKVAAVQQQADDLASKAKHDAQVKQDDLQKQIDQLKTDADAAKAKLDECTKAQSSADEQGKTADAALAAARQAFKEEGRLELADTNKALNELGPKSAKANAKQKTAFQKAIQPVAAQQKAIAADLTAYDTATLDTFKTVKAKLEHDLALLKGSVRTAKSKLPAS